VPFLHNAWYCGGWSDEVTRTPVARRMLGQPIMMFRTSDGSIAALDDRCAHRFAPLHKGEVDGDVITCPYHGLAYDISGACIRNPHGDGRIPSGARVKAYPVVERQRAVWIWMGDPSRAERDSIADLELVDDDPVRMLTGHMRMPVDYRLILDNLLDLTHAPYLHRGTFSSGGKTREANFETSGDYVRATYVDRNVDTPPSQRPFFDEPKGDYHTYIDWLAPGTLHNGIMMTTPGGDPFAGSVMRSGHLITPETETSSHYFWYSTRNRLVDDKEIDERLREIINRAFTTEDEPMIEACQTYMGGMGDLYSLKPISLPSDEAALRVRRTLERLIAADRRDLAGA
jgi:vanillate O-demethylase monooxygenase subunit